jgi:predicted MFS family arabinose efflux permease
VLAGFMQMQRATQRRGGTPLLDLALLEDRAFTSGIGATFCFFLGNLSFYFALTLFMQNGLGVSPFDAALTVMPMSLAFVVGSRLAAGRFARRGVMALIEGCIVQAGGLAALVALIGIVPHPTMTMLMLPLAVFGYGQGMVLTPLFSAVMANVRHAHAGSSSGMLATTQQIANGAGVVLVSSVFFSVQAVIGERYAMLAAMAVIACAVAATISFLHRMAATYGSAETAPGSETGSVSPAGEYR